MFILIALGVAGTLLGIAYIGLNGPDYPGGPTVTTWPIGVVALLVAALFLYVGFGGLRRMSSGAAVVHLLGGIALGVAIFVAAVAH
jgi:hypothetical protein